MRTIVAVATGAATDAGVGIVRLSGADAYGISEQLFRVRGKVCALKPNYMTLGSIVGGGMVEQAFCVYYKAPFSYTGEDVIEFHCHGGKAVLKTVVQLSVDLGAAPAARGEFTRRAFLNGKMTLDKAEGIYAMIAADSEAELNQASRLMGGELRHDIDRIAERLLMASANLEVSLDYPDEMEEDMRAQTLELLKAARAELVEAKQRAKLARLVREGAKVALVGKPNAGKSSLLNALMGEDRAIVTDIAGTTRDTLEGTIEISGVKVTFIDTAGLRETEDIIERIGVERAERAQRDADLILWIKDLTDCQAEPVQTTQKTIVVGNKADAAKAEGADIYVSAKTNEGLDALKQMIANRLDFASIASAAIITNERHRDAVETAFRATEAAIMGYENNSIDCIIVDIKTAYRALAEISGKDVSESVIDKIFESFCVGK